MPLAAVNCWPPTLIALTNVKAAVVVDYGAGCGSGGDGGSSARRRQRDSKALVGLHRGVAGDVDGDELAGLAGREADRPGRQRAAGEVGSVGSIGAAAGDGVGRRRCAGGVARAGDREGERRAAGVALGLACIRRRDRQRGAGVVVDDGAGCGSGGDGGSSARRRQRDSKALVGLHRGVAGDVDGDELAGLTGREADRPGRQRGAGEVGSVGGIGAAAGDGVGRRRCAGGVARAGDREGERRAAGVALGLACIRRRDRQRRPPASSLTMVPVAAAVAMVVPALGADSVTVKPSLASTVVSPATLMVTSLLVSPAAKLTVPVGNAAPVKSAALAALAPLPETV